MDVASVLLPQNHGPPRLQHPLRPLADLLGNAQDTRTVRGKRDTASTGVGPLMSRCTERGIFVRFWHSFPL